MPPVTGGQDPTTSRNQSTTGTATRVLEATSRNIPKLKEQNYSQWKSAITHSIKAAKLWGYIDGSIEEPPEQDASELIKYMDEAGAVRSAILGSLEPGAQRHIEDALAPREAWLALEKQYTAPGNDDQLTAIEKQLVDLRLEEDGDVVEHLVTFCRLRDRLHGTRFAPGEQSSIELLYRSLPPNYRQSVLTPERTEMKDFSALCARLRDPGLTKIPTSGVQVADTSSPTDDHTCWGVPEDIKAFGLTGDKNPLLEERAAVTCRDCLLKDHKAGTPECPQYEWRRELWGEAANKCPPRTNDPAQKHLLERLMTMNTNRLSYEFSEPVKVVLDFKELGLRLRNSIPFQNPSAIQQCALIPIINGRNVLAQAPHNNGKTTALAMSALHLIDTALSHIQVLVFTSSNQATTAFQNIIRQLDPSPSSRCHPFDTATAPQTKLNAFPGINRRQIIVGTPDYLSRLICRGILKTHHLKLLVLDDVDKIIAAGFEQQILEVYRQIPPLVQVVASSTSSSSPITRAIAKLLIDPLRIFVNRDQGISLNTSQFFIKAARDVKEKIRAALFSKLGLDRIIILCADDQMTITDYGRFTYYMKEAADPSEHANNISRFKGTYRSTLVATAATLPIAQLADMEAALVIYDIPGNTEDYSKLIVNWWEVHSGQYTTIVTFVADDTDEITTIRDFEWNSGIEMVELMWDGEILD